MSLETILDHVPGGWDPNVFNSENQRGPGIAMRFGSRPPSPDEVAQRGTPEWRAAFQQQRAWMNNQIFAGATLHDMGFDPEKGFGLHAYTALKAGDFAGYGTEPWGNVGPRGYYDSHTGAFTPLQGSGGMPHGQSGPLPGQPGFGSGGGGNFGPQSFGGPARGPLIAPTQAPSLGAPALPGSGPDVSDQATLIRRGRGQAQGFPGQPPDVTSQATLIRRGGLRGLAGG